VTDTQDLGSIFTRGTNYSAASASQQDAFPLSAGNSVQLDEDGCVAQSCARGWHWGEGGARGGGI
jgi:hypothetical protein